MMRGRKRRKVPRAASKTSSGARAANCVKHESGADANFFSLLSLGELHNYATAKPFV
jgi:hypothetical protein